EKVLPAPEDYEQLVTASAEVEVGDEVAEEDLAGLFYTGGTTGKPKGVMLTHRNLVANAFHMSIGAGYGEADTFLHAAPMFHLADGSSIYALTWLGARHVFLPAFDPAATLDLIGRERVTCTILVPTMINAVVHHPQVAEADLRSLRLILHGGAPIAAELLRRAVTTLGCSFTQAYGLTETSSLAAMLPREERLLDDGRSRSAGRAVMGLELAVRRPDGAECPPGEVGEVTARGPNVTSGYWNQPEQTAEALRDGWLWTGDLGRADHEGYLYLVDRRKDVIISGGENVYSVEVEAAVCAHPAVQEAAVIGVPDETWGERVHAVVVVRPGHTLDVAGLLAFCKERIAGYKCPRSMEVLAALPKSGAGKVLKRELRAQHWPDQERQVH
ncbi:MAG: class I adenylate-forming enzyme family protein, partial [Chloroflexota bacterium]